ncbi:MAG: hypothetical protein AAF647_01660 [Pseudomonadota bacterium]
MIRPEAKEAIREWQEVIAGVAMTLLGSHFLLNGRALLPVVGALIGLLGIALIVLGFRRVRFPTGAGGTGLVEVTERQIAYLTGAGGGAVAIDGLERVEVRADTAGITWLFTARSGEVLAIPGNARGAEALFDALVSLPGINHEEAVRAARSPSLPRHGAETFLIWQRDRKALH